MNKNKKSEEVLSETEHHLAVLLFKARTALWREWIETGSEPARQAYEITRPVRENMHE